MDMVDLDSLLPTTHAYRRFHPYAPDVPEAFAEGIHLKGADGYGIGRLFRCLLLQFMEDLSDRELQRYLEENLAAKWFCGFTLSAPTPAYSLFTRVRTRIGPTRLSQLFAGMRKQLQTAGLMSEGFTFVDATHLIAKATLWEERDKARQQKIAGSIMTSSRRWQPIRRPGLAVRGRSIGTATRNTAVWICSRD